METVALENLKNRLKQNPYPGRGIVLGKNSAGQWMQVYWIMGRSANSRNRIFTEENGILKTQAANPALVIDPSLIIYNAMRQTRSTFIVSNGVQTDTIFNGMEKGQAFPETLLSHQHEPDSPNFTPRISGCIQTQPNDIWLSIIKPDPFSSDRSIHQYFRYSEIPAGYGYAITTYRADGNPIPAFDGNPYLVPLQGNREQVAQTFWNTLNAENRISLAAREIDGNGKKSETRIINKFQ